MLRKGQDELVNTYRSGYCGVPAIPGGGKTFALTEWVVEALTEGINKDGKILIVTYMGSAVNNFKQRISAKLEAKGINSRDYFVSTIHSLCMQIIKESPEKVMIDEDFAVIDQTTKYQLLKEAINNWKRKSTNSQLYMYYIDEMALKKSGYDKIAQKWDRTFTEIMSVAISDMKINQITPKKAIERTQNYNVTSLLRIASEIYADYQYKLAKRGLIDFEDMLSKAKEILETEPDILAKFQKKYTYICEDEAQDSNKLQTDILTLIAGKDGNFLRVGDSNQAILTTFANSDMKLFKEFCENANTKVFHIVQSSRNTVDIINLANSFVKFVREEHPTEECRDCLLPQYIEPVDENDAFPNPIYNGVGIEAWSFKKKDDELEYIANKCKEVIAEDETKTTAILFPNKFKINELLKVLDEKKIKYEYLDNYAGERNESLVVLGRILDFIGMPEKNEKLLEVVKLFINEEVEGQGLLLEYLATIPTEDIFYPKSGVISTKNMPEGLLSKQAWKNFVSLKELLLDFLEFPFNLIEKLVLYIAEKLNFSKENMAIAQKVASTVRFLAEDNPRYKVVDLATELLNPKNTFNYFANIVWELKGYEAKPGIVTIATYHKSKGLEWDNVFLGGITSDEFPARLNDKFKDKQDYLKSACDNPTKMIKEDMAKLLGNNENTDYEKLAKVEIIGERARLLYVGITRAKRRLFCTTTKPSVYFKFIENNIV